MWRSWRKIEILGDACSPGPAWWQRTRRRRRPRPYLYTSNPNWQLLGRVVCPWDHYLILFKVALAYSWRFFCSACFQLCSTTTGMLLLIQRPRRVSGRVDHRHLHTRTQLVVQGVRTLRQWSSLPKELDSSQPTNKLSNQHANRIPPYCSKVGQKCYKLTAGADKQWSLLVYRGLFILTRLEIRTRI